MKKEDLKSIPMICGIDSLYYFIETNNSYDNFYNELIEQIELKKSEFEEKEVEYKNSDISVKLKNISLAYLNKAEGFYWFKDSNEFFRVGFKDNLTNRNLHNIRVQLQGVGIYTLGIKTLLSFINDNLLRDISSGLYPITRVDINCFINYDFSFIDKTMFASRKKRYMSICEFGSANAIQTIYVGKSPFLLRIYDKKLELKKSSKKELMYDYFLSNGLDLDKPIFNIEFEMHRNHLRAYNIKTLEDVLKNINNLFKKAMSDIRLIDTSTITKKDLKNNSKSRAKTLLIWEYIKESFDIDIFLQSEFSIKRLQTNSYLYDEDKFIEEFNKLIKKALTHQVYIDSEFISNLVENYFLDKEDKKEAYIQSQKPKRIYTPVSIKGDTKEYRLLNSGELIEPLKVVPVNELSNKELEDEITFLESQLFFGDINQRTDLLNKLNVAYEEKLKRLREKR